MCKIGIMLGTAGENLPSAILFMNSNKSEKNIRKKVAKTREKCLSHGIILRRDVVICKGPDRDGVGFLELSTIARITEAVQVQVGVYDKYNG